MRMPTSTALVSLAAAVTGLASAGKIEHEQFGAAVVNVHVFGADIWLPAASLAVTVAWYIVVLSSALVGVKVAVTVVGSYEVEPATVAAGFDAGATVKAIDGADISSLKVAVGATVAGTALVPSAGATDVTVGRVVSTRVVKATSTQ